MLIQFVGSVNVDCTFLLALSGILCALMAWVPVLCGLVEFVTPNPYIIEEKTIQQKLAESRWARIVAFDLLQESKRKYPTTGFPVDLEEMMDEAELIPSHEDYESFDACDYYDWQEQVLFRMEHEANIQIWDDILGQRVYVNQPPIRMAA